MLVARFLPLLIVGLLLLLIMPLLYFHFHFGFIVVPSKRSIQDPRYRMQAHTTLASHDDHISGSNQEREGTHTSTSTTKHEDGRTSQRDRDDGCKLRQFRIIDVCIHTGGDRIIITNGSLGCQSIESNRCSQFSRQCSEFRREG